MTRLEEKFRAADRERGGTYFRVSAEHPIDLFVGVEAGRRSILLVCPEEPPHCPLLQAMVFDKRLREDGKWALLLQLTQPELNGLFTSLAEDLVAVTSTVAYRADRAAKTLIERVLYWQRLLSRGRSGVLDDKELRGLVSELLFLVDHASPSFGITTAIDAWRGPYQAARDFALPGRLVEVKSVRGDATAISISSLDQLAPASDPLFLAVVTLQGLEPDSSAGFAVADLVRRVRTACTEGGMEVVAGLEDRLREYGYRDLPDYESIRFETSPPLFFRCAGDFPRIHRGCVPSGIVDCTYSIDISTIEPYKTSDWTS